MTDVERGAAIGRGDQNGGLAKTRAHSPMKRGKVRIVIHHTSLVNGNIFAFIAHPNLQRLRLPRRNLRIESGPLCALSPFVQGFFEKLVYCNSLGGSFLL